MALDPRTPVIVGVGAATQRVDDPTHAGDAVDLMVAAVEAARADAGAGRLASAVRWIAVPKGTWRETDPAREIAAACGATGAHTVRADLGVLQTTPLLQACDLVAAGDLDAALVVGGEAKYRAVRASITGTTLQPRVEADPDEVLAPDGDIISRTEISAGLVTATSHYALIENARRHADGQSLDEHARVVSQLWASFNAVARDNPEAWHRELMTAEQIRTPGPRNRPLTFPYNKWHNSQWNVDQAAALLICSVEVARAYGVPEDRWVFPLAGAESNLMVPVSERSEIHRSPGFRAVGRAALGHAGLGVDDVARFDLYSCFPIAVRTQALELGLPADRPLTVTGGMTFAGGPLNNYVLQALVRMVHLLRSDGDAVGCNTAISGMITKQGLVLLGTRPPGTAYRSFDVSAEVAAATDRRPFVERDGERTDATIATYTVVYGGEGPERAVAVCDLTNGRRTVAVSTDPDLAAAMTQAEFCGRRVVLRDGTFTG